MRCQWWGPVRACRGDRGGAPGVTPFSTVRAVGVQDDTPHHSAVMLQVDGPTFEAKPDTVLEGNVDEFMDRGAFD